MTVLAVFHTPGALRPTNIADVRLLAQEGERLRGPGGLVRRTRNLAAPLNLQKRVT
jgi:hypothetical protein